MVVSSDFERNNDAKHRCFNLARWEVPWRMSYSSGKASGATSKTPLEIPSHRSEHTLTVSLIEARMNMFDERTQSTDAGSTRVLNYEVEAGQPLFINTFYKKIGSNFSYIYKMICGQDRTGHACIHSARNPEQVRRQWVGKAETP